MRVPKPLVAFFLAGCLHLALVATGHDAWALWLKPLPVWVLAAWVARRGNRPIASGVVFGLVCSGVGDVLLELPDSFVLGMVAFAVAHLGYLGAMVRDERGRDLAIVRLVPFLAWSLGLLGACLPRLSGLRGAVVAYGLVLTLMLWRASARVRPTDALASAPVRMAMGAVVFGLSDSLILLRLAGVVGEEVGLVVILSYWLGQLGLASGAVGESSR